ncbi:MAG: hypothetical protein IJ463_08450 [Bacilli bacterium]|nr:hypothetical protein [Bacilli bacterium]
MKPSELNRLSKKVPIPAVGNYRVDFTLGNKKYKNYIFIEGNKFSNDYRVYNKIISNKCELFPSGTKDNIVRESVDYYPNLMSIVDRDYEFVRNKIPNLFYTDKNDIESTAIYLLDSYDMLFQNMKIDRRNVPDSQLEYIYNQTLYLSKKLSNFNYFIYNHNIAHRSGYSYLLNMRKGFCNLEKILKMILDNNDEIRTKKVFNFYEERYRFFDIDEVDFISSFKNNVDGFRGHDFFIILAYLLKKYNIRLLENEFNDRINEYLEKRFIDLFSNKKIIKNSNLYNDVVSNTKGFFEI